MIKRLSPEHCWGAIIDVQEFSRAAKTGRSSRSPCRNSLPIRESIFRAAPADNFASCSCSARVAGRASRFDLLDELDGADVVLRLLIRLAGRSPRWSRPSLRRPRNQRGQNESGAPQFPGRRVAGKSKARRGQAPCGLEVDYQLELDRGLDGKLARLRAPEDAIRIAHRGRKLSVTSVRQQGAEFR